MVDKPAFKMRDHVEKISGSSWRGRVVGTYSTDLTREGYAVESDTEKGSVQIYPAKALRLATPANGEQVERGLRDALAVAKRAILKAAQDTLWCDDCPIETVVDRIDAAIAEADRQQTLNLSTPREDARERVKVLEEAASHLEARGDECLAGSDNKSTGNMMRTIFRHEASLIRALGNKETDRHG